MSHFLGRDILKAGMHEYFTKFAMKNTQLPDFIQCCQNAAAQLGRGDLDIQGWTDSWLTKSGANEIIAHLDQVENGGKIRVQQFFPPVGDPVHRSQVIRVKLFAQDQDGNLQQHVQQFTLEAASETILDCDAPFKPEAALLNSGNLGYARVLLSEPECQFFLKHLAKVGDQLDRTYLWMILYDHLKMQRVKP